MPITQELLMHAALLWAEPAALSHRSAASLWGFEGFVFKIEVTVASNVRSKPGVVVHRRTLLDDEIRIVRGLKVTSPELTILDLCAVDHRQAEIALDDEWGMTFHADLAYPEQRLAIECESYEFHSGGHEWDRDLRRRNIVTLTSWRVLHVTHRRLVDDAAGFISELRTALGKHR